MTHNSENLANEFVLFYKKEILDLAFSTGMGAIVYFRDPNERRTILAATFAAMANTILSAHAACLVKDTKENPRRASPELMLFSALLAVHAGRGAGRNALELRDLALKDLASLGHEIPETLVEWSAE